MASTSITKFVFLLMLSVLVLSAQTGVRVDPAAALTISSQSSGTSLPEVLALPYALVNVCNAPVNAIPCTNFATTYTDATLATACPLSQQVVLAGGVACGNKADGQGNFGFWLAPGQYFYQTTWQGTNFGPYPLTAAGGGSTALTTFNPGWTGTSSTSLQNILTAQYIYMDNFAGFSTSNSDNAPQFNAAIAIAGMGSIPSVIVVPPGQYLVCSTILMDQTSTRLEGAGWGNPSEYAGSSPTTGTVIKACPTFNSSYTGTNFWKNYVIALNCATDCYEVRAEHMTVDGAGVADALYVGHVNEESGYSWITAENFIHFGGGMFMCGAGIGGGPGGGAQTNCGGNGSGNQGDGPYLNLQFGVDTPNATAATVPVVIIGSLGVKDMGNWTITGEGPAVEPEAAAFITGTVGLHLHDVHVEATQTGFKIGEQGSICPFDCTNGVTGFNFENIDLTQSSTPSSAYAMELYSCISCNLSVIHNDVSGDTLPAILTDFNSTIITSTDSYVSWFTTRAKSGAIYVLSSDPSWPFELTNSSIIFDHQLQLFNDDTYQLTFQSRTSPFNYMAWKLGTNGAMTVSASSSGIGNLFWDNPYSFIVMGGNVAPATSSLFMQGPAEAGNGYIRGLISSSIYWNHANQNWTASAYPGSNDYSALYFPLNGGACISTSNATGTSSVSNTAFLANSAFCTTQYGHSIFGANAPAVPDTSGSAVVQIIGNQSVTGNQNITGVIQTGASGNTDNSGQLSFSASTTSTTYTFTGTYSHEPVCTTSLDGGNTIATSPVLGSSGAFYTITAKAASAVTSTVNYSCSVRP